MVPPKGLPFALRKNDSLCVGILFEAQSIACTLPNSSIVKPPLCAWPLTCGESHRWTTAVNVKRLLPPRQSRGTSPVRLGLSSASASHHSRKSLKRPFSSGADARPIRRSHSAARLNKLCLATHDCPPVLPSVYSRVYAINIQDLRSVNITLPLHLP